MPWDTETISKPKGIEEVYAFDIDRPDDKFHVYTINKPKKIVTFFPKDVFCVKKITLEGFQSIPEEFSEFGYIKASVQYYLNKKIEGKNVSSVIISKTKNDSFRKYNNKFRVIINYESFKWLKQKLTQITNESKRDKSLLVDEFFHKTFPRKYPKQDLSSKQRATRVIRNLDSTIIEHLSPDDISKIFDFVESMLSTRYSSNIHRRKLLSAAKVKIDDVALAEVISKFETLLEESPSEKKWGEFLEKNLFLVESKYIKIMPELNVVLAGARKVDFGLVDAQGYLDIFEIKKPNTKLLASNTDRGNYYWSTEAVKAIVQAEKYLFNAERKASSLSEDISRERGIKVEIVKPRAVVVMGSSVQLEADPKMREDFRILRMSLKNIEIVLYDELLDRLKNQRNKIFIE